MADTIKNRIKIAIMPEVTEGTYLAPASSAAFISPLTDGIELTPSKEQIQRNNLNTSIGKSTQRSGMRSVTASLPVEAKAHGTAGSKPEYGLLLESALGAVRQNENVITSKASGNTASTLQIEDADIDDLNVGDIVLIKQAGAYHVTPITSKTSGTGTASVTVLVPHPSGDFADSVTVEKFTTYYTANCGHPTLSISKYLEDARLEYAAGCRVTSMSLNNFSTGQLVDFSFELEGLNYDHSLTAPSYTPAFNSALPPIALSAKVYQDGAELALNEVTINVENTLAFKTSTASEFGKISSRITQRVVSGSINPYKQSDSVSNFLKFTNDSEFSLFGYMGVPTGVAGQFKDVVAFYMPKCQITELTETDQNGLIQEQISFNATRGPDGSSEELYIGII